MLALDMTPKAQTAKPKTDKWEHLKLKKFLQRKWNNSVNKALGDRRNYLRGKMHDMMLIYKRYKELLQLHSKKVPK